MNLTKKALRCISCQCPLSAESFHLHHRISRVYAESQLINFFARYELRNDCSKCNMAVVSYSRGKKQIAGDGNFLNYGQNIH